nr:MAG TPA: hypothetical protein [Caudoviricetes sp.]
MVLQQGPDQLALAGVARFFQQGRVGHKRLHQVSDDFRIRGNLRHGAPPAAQTASGFASGGRRSL